MNRKSFRDRLKNLVVFALILVLYYIIITITHIGCPIKYVTGISCPGCGMSRAFLHLIEGDIGGAIHYHPLIFLSIPFVIYFFLGSEKTEKLRRIKKIITFVAIAVLIGVYIYRLVSGQIAADFHDGLIYRVFNGVRQVIY